MRHATRRRWAAAVLGLLALLMVMPLLATGSAAAPPASRQRLVLNEVHTDVVDVQYADGALGLRTRVGAPPYEFHTPEEVIFQLKDVDAARLRVPDDPRFAFLGAPGDPVWIAPQVQDLALVFAGWSTESILPGVLRDDALDLSLVEVSGPGHVEVYGAGLAGPDRVFSGTDPALRTRRQAVDTHVHANWAFTALGRYQLTFEVRATAADGTTPAPARATYTWYVGGAAAGDVVPDPTQISLSATPQSPPVGEPVTLSASVSPSTATGWVEFFDGTTSLGFSPVGSGQATMSTSDLASGSHTITATFSPAYANDYASATSPPVTLVVTGTGPSTPASPSASPTVSRSPTASPTPSPSGTPGTPDASPTPTTAAASTSHSSPARTCVPVTRTSTRTTTSNAVILDNGHVDYAARISGGRITSQVKDGTVAGRTTWRDPSEVVFHLKPVAATTIPASGFDFLGRAGARIWQIPQTQQQGILWLGWNTEEISAAQISGNVSWSLEKVQGPGRLAVYLFDSFGRPQIVFNSGDGLPDRYAIPVGTHAHGNWAFTAEGTYRLTFTHRVTLAGGRSVSDTAVVTVAVGDTDPRPLARRTTSRVDTYTGSSCGPLALTGFPLIGPLVAGIGLLVLGVLTVALTHLRRRRSS